MEQPYLKAFSRWLRVCMMAGALPCLSAGAFAQGSAGGTASPAKKTPGAKTTSSNHAKTASSGSKAAGTKAASTGAAQPRSASRLSSKHTSSRPKPGAHGAHNSKIADSAARANSISKKQGTNKQITAQGQHSKGQQKINPARAQAIQEALIREHYMDGEPAGFWNQESEEAMRRYQADHGWQSKEVPDSRALISLGLGPSHDHLLNPESAMTSGPDISHSASASASSPQNPASHEVSPASPGDPISTSSDHSSAGPQ